jgi:uncharacterized protein YjiK
MTPTQLRSSPSSRRHAFAAAAICLVLLLFVLSRTLGSGHEQRLVEVLAPKALAPIPKNLSGLTWNAETGPLFAVTNDPERAFELSPDGNILRSIVLRGFKDTEGITHIEGSLFAVVEERRAVLSFFDIPPGVTEIEHGDALRLDLDKAPEKNKGFESVSYDPATRTIFTMREGKPFVRLSLLLDEHFRPTAIRSSPLPALRVKDVASIVFAPDGNLWVLSEASARIVELGSDGETLRTFRLNTDGKRFRPEGITLGPDGTIFVVGEPNILAAYRTQGN